MKGRNRQYPARPAIQYPLNKLIMGVTIRRGVPTGTYLQHDAFLQGQFFFMTLVVKIQYLNSKLMLQHNLCYPGIAILYTDNQDLARYRNAIVFSGAFGHTNAGILYKKVVCRNVVLYYEKG